MQGIDCGSVIPSGKPGTPPGGATGTTKPVATNPDSGVGNPATLRIYDLISRLPGPKNFAVRIFMFFFLCKAWCQR